jgi:hypothetical protein
LRAVAVLFAFARGTFAFRAALRPGTIELPVTTWRALAAVAHLRTLASTLAITWTALGTETITVFHGRTLSVARSHLRALAIARATLRSETVAAHVRALGKITIPRAALLVHAVTITHLRTALRCEVVLPFLRRSHPLTFGTRSALAIAGATLRTNSVAALHLGTLSVARSALWGETISAHLRALC